MAARKSPVFDTATTLGKILAFLGVSAICGVLAAGLLVPAAAVAGVGASSSIEYFENLPAELRQEPLSVPSKIVANDGTPIATFYAENRVPVTLDQVSEHMVDALIAIEDYRFYEHSGVDPQGIMRAVVHNISNDTTQGASTLTQQYVNNVLINADSLAGKENLTISGTKDIGDKLREAKLAIAVEKQFTKDEILQGYLNIVLFSGTTYGVEAASQHFFGIPAKNLNIQQGALLAGMVQSPNGWNPVSNPEGALKRRNVVLQAMLTRGKITQAEYDAAVASPIELNVTPVKAGCISASMAPYFCNYVQRTILASDAFGATEEDRAKLLNRGGLTIKTTLDPRLQTEAQAQIVRTVPVGDPSDVGGAISTIEPGTGRILAMAQNTRYTPETGAGNTELNFNADKALGGGTGFQAGSTMKPVTTVAWMEAGRTLNENINASRDSYPAGYPWKASCLPKNTKFPQWNVGNALEGFNRNMSVMYGLTRSINSATAAEAAQLDLCKIADVATRLGIHRADNGAAMNPARPSFIIGAEEVAPLTMANAFATFGSGGIYCKPIAIDAVTDQDGNAFKVPQADCNRVIEESVVNTLHVPLREIIDRLPGSNTPFPSAGKTGTSDQDAQSWTVGYTTGLASAVWVGTWKSNVSMDNRPINGISYKNVYGQTLAGPTWLRYMTNIGRLYETDNFPSPSNRSLGNQAPSPRPTAPPAPPQEEAPASESPAPESLAPASPAPAAPAPAAPAPAAPATPAAAPAPLFGNVTPDGGIG